MYSMNDLLKEVIEAGFCTESPILDRFSQFWNRFSLEKELLFELFSVLKILYL
jgi:hypothetical protein